LKKQNDNDSSFYERMHVSFLGNIEFSVPC